MLYEVAYAACYDDDDLRGLAQAFEAMQIAPDRHQKNGAAAFWGLNAFFRHGGSNRPES